MAGDDNNDAEQEKLQKEAQEIRDQLDMAKKAEAERIRQQQIAERERLEREEAERKRKEDENKGPKSG